MTIDPGEGARRLKRGKAWLIPGFGSLSRRLRRPHQRRKGGKLVSVRAASYLTATPTAAFRRRAGL